MKTPRDEAVEEVRAARKALCDRFANDSRRLLAYLRRRQRRYHGRIIRDWADLGVAPDAADGATRKRLGAHH